MKQINAPEELIKAADVVLDQRMRINDAEDLFRYLVLTRSLERAGGMPGGLLPAARKLGITAQALSQGLKTLEKRL